MRLLFILILIIFELSANDIFADTLSPFRSDGCSLFPDGTITQQSLWLDCCLLHDFAYWKGGTSEARSEADDSLKVCVANVMGKSTAFMMLVGTRVGGSPWLPTPFRWGYGWPYPRFYGELTLIERQIIKAMMDVNDVPLLIK